MQIPSSEYDPFFESYISKLAAHEDIRTYLSTTFDSMKLFLKSIPESKISFAYEEGKWTIAELIQHCIDTERIMGMRAMRIARNDKTPLAGFDENEYAQAANVVGKSLKDFITEWELLRRSNVIMFASFTNKDLERKTKMSNYETSTRAVAGIIIGHGLHHINILRERYLK